MLNNQGVITYFNLQDDLPFGLKHEILDNTREKFRQALQLYPNNLVTIINSAFLEFNCGNISDEGIQKIIQTKVHKLNPTVSFMLYLLFKMNV